MTGEIFMREASLTGMTGREVSLHLASENAYGMGSIFQQTGKKGSDFQFIDAAGKKWKTDACFNMLGRTLLHNNASNGKAHVFSAELKRQSNVC